MARARGHSVDAGRPTAWAGANIVPIVLIPLAAVLVWVAIWKVWLPRPDAGGAVGRTVTTVDANAATRPTHRVTTVVRTTVAATPSRRSETLAIVLVLVGVGAAMIAVFHDRIGSIELDRTGIKIDLTKVEQEGAAELVGRLAATGAGPRTTARALGRYVRAVAARRPPAAAPAPAAGAVAPSLSADQARAIAAQVADRSI